MLEAFLTFDEGEPVSAHVWSVIWHPQRPPKATEGKEEDWSLVEVRDR